MPKKPEPLTPFQVEQEIAALCKRFETALDNLAAAVGRAIIKPFCDENGLRFVTGMGIWTFDELEPDPDDPPISTCDWDDYIDGDYARFGEDYAYKRPPDGYQEIRELLNHEVGATGRPLFEYMNDYDPEAEGKEVARA